LDPSVPTPTPPEYIVHIVGSGETLLSIAAEYDVSVALIRTANDLPQDDDTIRVNQSLIIPLGTPMPSPTPTTNPNATPIPSAPYPASPLLSPPDGATIMMNTHPLLLQWASVSVLKNDEWYMVTLDQPPGGVISATILTRATAWRVPLDLLAMDSPTREFHWQVQVAQETLDRWGETIYRKVGAPSQVRTFHLLLPTPTPKPTLTP
ncbi:MAG TPA: LysM domain-containing protein, partial [Chloroflexi bacterium]|nr:LysM domain-containing protein [Chloroflexota bacterium]